MPPCAPPQIAAPAQQTAGQPSSAGNPATPWSDAMASSQGRFIEFCQSVVDEWSGKLRTVDAVLSVWQKVQANWCRLEPIFMLSDGKIVVK